MSLLLLDDCVWAWQELWFVRVLGGGPGPSISMRRHEAARDSNCSVLPGVCCPQAPAADDGGHSQDLAADLSPFCFL